MVDTTTPLLGLLLQATGGNNNAWGTNLNDSVITLAENAIAGQAVITPAGGTYTLSAIEARASSLIVGGTLTSNLTIVVPDTAKNYRIFNNNAGSFFTLLKCTTNATTVNVPRKITEIVVYGGVPYRCDRAEVGRYVHDAASVNGDSVECNGTAYLRTLLPDLFAKIGVTYGNNDATDFKVPDAYTTGKFLRSRTAAVAVGTAQTNQNKSHTHTGSGTSSGQSVGHTHTGSGTSTGVSVGHTHTGSGTTSIESVGHSHTGSGNTGAESATHTHSGTTAGTSVSLAHDHTYSGTGSTTVTTTRSDINYGGSSDNFQTISGADGRLYILSGTITSTGSTSYSGTTSTSGTLDHNHTITTGTESAAHAHAYSFTTSGVSANHSHTYSFTTSAQSADHTHNYSFTTAAGSADHTHTYSFTTSAGSADGTEARPESLVGILCIRY